MRPFFCLIFLFCSAFTFAQKTDAPYVVLISFDGFRYDYVEKFDLPNFKEFIRQGSSAKALIPSFPSKTFPNHYTIVTGLYPGHHGLVDNAFYDPSSKIFYSGKNRSALLDPRFYGGTPLWQLAKQQGLRTASYFWIGSEIEIQGALPDYYLRYDASVADKDRVDQVLQWLNLPEKERPHFITLYFSFLDTQSHNSGPNSEALKQAALRADSVLGSLSQRIGKTKLPVNMIVLSDHGMLELKQEENTYITLGKLFNIADTSVVYVNGGTQAHLYTKRADSLYNILKEKESTHHFNIYKRGMFPEMWHYDIDRAGDLLLVASPGYYIQPTAFAWKQGIINKLIGNHGYDPYVVREMHGIFYAKGPNIKRGQTLEPFANIHVYPFIATILGLKIPEIDGKVEVLKSLYKK